ncbi:MAG TPA: zinc ribbon domain-containing protein [Microlunatus sp.]|nr:zinc ribbon domain-containing protein [Microlunatus sp.]
MECPRCRAELPEVAHFCHVCGQDQRSPDQSRRKAFAVKPDEPVASFALISTIMPRGVGERPQTYRITLVIALVVALVAAIFGALPIAVLVAAFAMPLIYIVYIYDVNLWDDAPVPVTAMTFGLTGVLAIVFTIIWTGISGPQLITGDLSGVISGPTLGGFLLAALLVPVIGEAIRQIGPLVLASRPKFDDLMDGLTFGVISGVAYATFDTLVRHWSLLTGGIQEADPGVWVSLIFLEGFVKPLIMGTATGIACAEFSGLGRGYDGFTPRYFRGLAEAVVANIAYAAGSYFFSFLGNLALNITLNVIWGVLILAILILRVRNVLHVGLMEAALERTAREGGIGEHGELDFCARCEMPLMEHAAFCNACGTAVRVQPKAHHDKARVGAAAVSAGAPAPGPDQGQVPPAPDAGVAEDTLIQEQPAPGPVEQPPVEQPPVQEPFQQAPVEGQVPPPAEAGPAPGEAPPPSPEPGTADGEEGRK